MDELASPANVLQMFETPKNRPKPVNKKVLLLPRKHLRKWRSCGNDEATGRCYPEILTEK
jgi:hypothetical protein